MLKSNADYNKLITALKENNKEAFDIIYTDFRNRLYAVAYLILKEQETAKDLVQDFFIDFWQNQLYLNITTALPTYLTNSIRNRALNLKKSQQVAARLKQSFVVPEFEETLYRLENRELNAKITAAITSLPPMASKVFELHYIEKLSHQEISERLGISKSTISSHLDRALKELRSTLKKFLKTST